VNARDAGPALVNLRALAARVVSQVAAQGHSLDTTLPQALGQVRAARDRPLLQQLCYGTLRWQPRLAWLADQLLNQPLKARDAELGALLWVGLYQLEHLRIPAHAAVAETVEAARALGRPWATRLVNAVLRGYQRRNAELNRRADRDPVARHAHPAWLLERLRADWPGEWEAVAAADNRQPPMTLRISRLHHPDPAAYFEQLAAAGLNPRPVPGQPWAVGIDPVAEVRGLPGFDHGEVSVQDAAAQLAADLLEAAPGQRVLDACAAPGGKTAHILECTPDVAELVALDISSARLGRVRENLDRLGLDCTLRRGDAARPEGWWDGAPFERILLDAPCSATGVIRRHPDIKLLRRPGDIPELARTQAAILTALWPLLRPGGMLVYATCSALAAENEQVVEAFLATHGDARERPIDAGWGLARPVGRQILPGQEDRDGFFYARLEKPAEP
jgi:16S rRNA (cytosine967-C5)-methyltransferase